VQPFDIEYAAHFIVGKCAVHYITLVFSAGGAAADPEDCSPEGPFSNHAWPKPSGVVDAIGVTFFESGSDWAVHADNIGFGRRLAIVYRYQLPVASHVWAVNLGHVGRRGVRFTIKQAYVSRVDEVGATELE
jgi:hypothetical protein